MSDQFRPHFRQEPSLHFITEPVQSEDGENFGQQKRITDGVNRLLGDLQRLSTKDRREIAYTFPLLLCDVSLCPTPIQMLVDHQMADSVTITYTKDGDDDEVLSVETSDREATLMLSYCPSENPLEISGLLVPHDRADKKQDQPVRITREDFRKWLSDTVRLVAPDDVPRIKRHRPYHETAANTDETRHYTTPNGHEVVHRLEHSFGSLLRESFSIEYDTGTPGRTLRYVQTSQDNKFEIIDRNVLEQARWPLLADDGDLRRLAEILEDEAAALRS